MLQSLLITHSRRLLSESAICGLCYALSSREVVAGHLFL